jgi:predicted dehydrogenase
MSKPDKKDIPRRQFLKTAAAAVTAGAVFPQIVPRHVVGGAGHTAPSDTVYVAGIGFGSMGGYDIRSAARSGAVITTLCDVDFGYAGKNADDFPKAKRYNDYRELFAKQKDFDAVIIGTPDHTHAVIAMEALRNGKHVYCEKPLAHTMYEVRRLTEAARESGLTFQLANQGHTYPTIFEFCECIWSGEIGEVREIHIQLQGFNYSRVNNLDLQKENHPVPKTLDYDLWLGPSQFRKFIPSYHPGAWRGWSNFGTGMIGDWTCHLIDPVYTAFDLGAPTSVIAEAEGFDHTIHGETFPMSSHVKYEFPARGQRPPLTMHWYDGERYTPPHPEELEEGEVSIPLTGRGQKPVGALVIGDKGKIAYGTHGAAEWRIIDEDQMNNYMAGKTRAPDPRGQGMPENVLHLQDWLLACKGYKENRSNLEYGGPLTEIALLGTIAQHVLETELTWDAKHMMFPSNPEANQYLHKEYREGWSL